MSDKTITNRSNLNLLYFSHFIIDAYASFLMPILPLLTQKFEISIFIMSIIMAASYLGSSILQPVFGNIADRTKGYYFITLGLICTCLTIGFVGKISNIFLLASFIIIMNLGEGLYHPQATTLISTLSGEKKLNKNLGIYLGLGVLGFGFGPIACGYIVNNYGLNYLAYTSIFALILIVAIYFFLRNIPKNVDKEEGKVNFFYALTQIFADKNLRRLIMLGFMRPLILITFCVYVPFLLKEHGYNTFLIGLFIGLFSLVGALGSYIGGILTKIIDRIYIFIFSLVFATVFGMISIYLLSSGNHAGIIFYLLTSFCINLHSSINLSIAYEITYKNKGAIAGIINGFNWGIVGLSLSLIGYLIDIFSVAKVLFIIALIPSLFALNLFGLKRSLNNNQSQLQK